jgi:hypothetical protein
MELMLETIFSPVRAAWIRAGDNMRARRLITAVFLLTCAKLAEPDPARPLAAQRHLGRWN